MASSQVETKRGRVVSHSVNRPILVLLTLAVAVWSLPTRGYANVYGCGVYHGGICRDQWCSAWFNGAPPVERPRFVRPSTHHPQFVRAPTATRPLRVVIVPLPECVQPIE